MTPRRAALSTISQPCRASFCRWSKLLAIHGRVVMPDDVVVGGRQEPAGATGRVADGVT